MIRETFVLYIYLIFFFNSDIGHMKMTSHIVREKTRLSARILLYALYHRQDNTSRREVAGTRNSSVGPP